MDDSSVAVVQVVESSFVAPSEATPSKALWLSPLDVMQTNRGSYTPTLYLYDSSPPGDDTAAAADFFDVITSRLKESLAKALVHFYPLAGRLDIGDDGRAEISCNGEGALFVVARSDRLTVGDIRDMKPSPELRSLVVPRVDPPSIILAIQVIFLKCGGVAIGTAMHHAAIDASSALHFFQTWSAICRNVISSNGEGGAAVELPCHDRTLLRARSPPSVHPDALSRFYPKVTLSEPSGPIATAVFSISVDQVASLKRLCGGASTFCALGALVWQCQCTCLARRLCSPDSEARVVFPVNIRRRMRRPPLPDRYFGNAVIRVCAAGAVGDVASEALATVAGRIRGVISGMDDELLHSAIDYFEMMAAQTSSRRSLKGAMPETELLITSWLGTPMHDADFGWGKPQVMTRAESVRGGYVYLMNDGADDSGGGGVRVLMSLEAQHLKEMERLLYAKLLALTTTY